MAPLQYLSSRKLLPPLCLLLFSITCMLILCATTTHAQSLSNDFQGTRRILLDTEFFGGEEEESIKKKATTFSTKKNQTKLIKPPTTTSSSKNQTSKLIKSAPKINQTKLIEPASDLTTKNKTKLIKPTKDSSTKETLTTIKAQLKKPNSTSGTSSSNPNKKTTDLFKSSSPKNKTTKALITTKQSHPKSKIPDKNQATDTKPKSPKAQKSTKPSWIDQEDEEENDLIAEFRDLPSRFQETLLPDLEKISTTSKVYLNKANKEITKGFKPIVGTKYAPAIASIVSFAFILIPLILVSLIFNRIKAYFSLQKLLIFIQIYLSIYFSILCLSSIVTGLEPLRFFYATSQSTYICLQVLQTLGYVLYLLLLLMYLILVFSTETGPGSKMLGLAQTFVGFAVGLHYYVTVFHRVVLHQPPKTNWKVHGIYATCFLVICLLARADRRKKAYLVDGAEEGKKS